MSVLTFQLTKMGLKGYELDYDYVDQYFEKYNPSHPSGRVQRVEEADADWKATYDFVMNDLIVPKTRKVHDYEQWKDVDELYFDTGEMHVLEGSELARECIGKICKKFSAKFISEDRKYVDDFRDAMSRAAANVVANRKLGMKLPTERLIQLRCRYCVLKVIPDRVDEVLCAFSTALTDYCQSEEG
ncbi:MAG: hypothetical protein IKZ44_08980 [Clostridia bacterium]|nr:hypothetical protein [Clostridia bacterium]